MSGDASPDALSDSGRATRDMEEPHVLLENVLSAYINRHRQIEYAPGLVHMCGPFTVMMVEEAEIYYCFEHVMRLVGMWLVLLLA